MISESIVCSAWKYYVVESRQDRESDLSLKQFSIEGIPFCHIHEDHILTDHQSVTDVILLAGKIILCRFLLIKCPVDLNSDTPLLFRHFKCNIRIMSLIRIVTYCDLYLKLVPEPLDYLTAQQLIFGAQDPPFILYRMFDLYGVAISFALSKNSSVNIVSLFLFSGKDICLGENLKVISHCLIRSSSCFFLCSYSRIRGAQNLPLGESSL